MNTQCDMNEIMSKVSEQMNAPAQIAFCSKNKVVWKNQLEAYLLAVSSYYFKIYHKQDVIHVQAIRAMNLWSQLLTECTRSLDDKKMRKIFTTQLFALLEKEDYALMKNNNELLIEHKESSDFDLFIAKEAALRVLKWIKVQPEVVKLHVVRSSYMKVASIYFKDGSFLSVDFINQLKQRSSEYLSVESIIKQTNETVDRVKIPSVEQDIEYIILFYLLNNAPIPQKYKGYIDRLTLKEEEAFFNKLKSKMNFSANSFDDFFLSDSKGLTQEIKGFVNKKSENKGWKGITNRWCYFFDSIRKFTKGRGLVVSFSGVDGAGKSTIITHIKATLEQRFRRNVIVLRHRPSVLPILSSFIYGKKAAEKKAANTLPRQGQNSSTLSSLFRFTYYLFDFLFGQFVVWFKYTMRGDIILYDRYYFDFIEDAKRTNITLPRWFRKLFYRFIYKPSVNIFLHAKPELILKRKQELTHHDIVKLTASYQNLFRELDKKYSGKYVSIENDELDFTLNQIESLITAAA